LLLLFAMLAAARPPAPPVTGVFQLPAGVIEVAEEIRLPAAAHDLEIRGDPAGTVLKMSERFQGRALWVCESARRIRFTGFAVDGSRDALEVRTGLAPYDVPFARFTRNNGILADQVEGLDISAVTFRHIAGFAVLVSRSQDVAIESVRMEDSGSRNAKGRNNATGGILLEEGTSGFRVTGCTVENVRGNGIWTHTRYGMPRSHEGTISANRFRNIGRDAIQVGHATMVRVEKNTGDHIGYPVEDVDIEGQAIPAAIDTAGDVDHTTYAGNRFDEINGKCMDLDGFHDGEIRGNTCVNARGREAYPYGNYAIVMNNSNPDMRSENIRIVENEIDGTVYGGIFVIGSNHTIAGNRMRRLNLAHCGDCYYKADEPDMLRSGIYLGKGAERPAPARANTIEHNTISGWGMKDRCVARAPGIAPAANRVAGNICRDEK
jgi:hypothetical protein